MAHTPPKPDGNLDVDLLVVGAGADGFTGALAAAARGLRVLIVEKAPQFGGSTALSGGGIWAPGADALLRDGYSGTEQEALTYLEEITAGEVSRERLIAYLQHAPAAIDFLESLGSRLQFAWKPGYPDYFPELPGGSAQGRFINGAPIDLRELGVDEPLLLQGPGIRGFWLTSRELRTLYTLRHSRAGKAMFGKVLWRMLRARFTGERINTLGAALAARLPGRPGRRYPAVAGRAAHRPDQHGRQNGCRCARATTRPGRHRLCARRPAHQRRLRSQSRTSKPVPAGAHRRLEPRKPAPHGRRADDRTEVGCRDRPDGQRLVVPGHRLARRPTTVSAQ